MAELSKSLSEQIEGVLRLVLDTLPAPIIEFNKELKVEYANRSAQQLTGYVMGELQNGRFSLEQLVAPVDRIRLRETLYRVLALEALDKIDVTLQSHDGSHFSGRLNIEVLFRRAAVYGVRASITGSDGDIRGLPVQPGHSHARETIGRLAINTLNDIHHRLQIISGYTDLALSHSSATNPGCTTIADYLSIVRDMARQCGDMVTEVMDYGRRDSETWTRTDVHAVITRVIKLLGCSAVRGVHVAADFNTLYSNVSGHPDRLEDTFLNLLYNARDALPDGGGLYVTTQGRTISFPRTSAYGFQVRPGQYLVISIRGTTGKKNVESEAEQPVDIFSGTKGTRHVPGLSLTDVYNTIKAHNGFFEVSGTHSDGSVVEVFLPLSDTLVDHPSEQEVLKS